MLRSTNNKTSRWPYIIVAILVLVLAIGIFIVNAAKNLSPEKVLENSFVRNQIENISGVEIEDTLFDIVPPILGFDTPKTYLLLFQNNTEMRPAGGFIGVYAAVRIENGHPNILVVDGTENIDRNAPDTFRETPPTPIQTYLGLDRWFFRDSNWFPDFQLSAKKALEFYTAEGGVAASDIDGVIAITPTVLEEFMKITGPFTIQGITFTQENVIETLEYEVEYGYRDRGIPVRQRKQIIKVFMNELIAHLKDGAIQNISQYLPTITTLLDQQHILVALHDPQLQTVFTKEKWAGEQTQTAGDYLQWVDANLAALKTDHAIERSLSYTTNVNDQGEHIATASMTYTHNGTFDWRTSRYLTYARIYTPLGSELIEVIGSDQSLDQAIENNKQSFGAYYKLEPGQTGTLTFRYKLPPQIFNNSGYSLVVDKQSGTINPGLTLNIDFGTTIAGANPPEEKNEWGDRFYKQQTDLSVGRTFTLQ